MKTVLIDNHQYQINDYDLIGSGGEAEVYQVDNFAVKLYHPQNLNNQKIKKIIDFPKNLPNNVLSPLNVVYSYPKSTPIGFNMNFVEGGVDMMKLSNKSYRDTHQIDNNYVNQVFISILNTVLSLHKQNIIIGDFNDANILFKNKMAYFIDADSMQFKNHPCEVATEQFLDPILFGKNLAEKSFFTNQTDAYSYAVMLFKSLLYVHPFGGVHPKIKRFIDRVHQFVSVFDSSVKYPKAAIDYRVLNDDLLHYFHNIFLNNKRDLLDIKILNNIKWKKCSCGYEYAGNKCPYCGIMVAPQQEKINIGCSFEEIFNTINGTILFTKIVNGEIKIIHRENNDVFLQGKKICSFSNNIKFDIDNDNLAIGRNNLVEIGNKKYNVDTFKKQPMFSLNDNKLIRIDNGRIISENIEEQFPSQVVIGNVLKNQTWFKCNQHVGIGFYQLGKKIIYFTFNPQTMNSVNDDIKLPQINGQLLGASAYFSGKNILFSMLYQERGVRKSFISLIINNKIYEMEEQSNVVDNINNRTIGGEKILLSSDSGINVLQVENEVLSPIKVFSETSQFVNNQSRLLPSSQGIYVISTKNIGLLKIKK